MKIINIALLFGLVNINTLAAEATISIAAAHLQNLGVVIGHLEPVSTIPLLYAPATVSIPPSHEYIVSSSQPGLITKMTAAIGDKVKKGALLAQVNSPALLALQGQYLKAGSVLQLAAVNYKRDQKLLKDGVIASRREQESLAQYKAALLDANEAKQLLEIAGMSAAEIAQLDNSHRLHGELSIVSPISGAVIERMAVAGARIDSMAPLYRIADLDELWLEIAIPQERMHDLKLGDQVLIENTQTKATINLIGQSVNPATQSVLARALIKGLQPGVRVGQKVNIQIIQPSTKANYKIPNAAIAQNAGKSYVFVQTATGFRIIDVEVLGKVGAESIISGDLVGSDAIAVKGAVALKANWLGLGSEE